jgi:pilus assembly protein TadC
MKLTGIILIILGSLLFLLNVIASFFSDGPPDYGDMIYKLAYYTGFYSFAILGIILIVIGFFLRRRATRKKQKKELLSSLPGKESA